MKIIGITGSIGMGKTTISSMLKLLGIPISPLMLWVFLWIGVPVLGLLFGDIYAKFNPLNLFPVSSKKPQSVYFACV